MAMNLHDALLRAAQSSVAGLQVSFVLLLVLIAIPN